MSDSPLHTVIVGGGIAGLACAHRLARDLGRDRVRLLEASDYLGGHVRTTREMGYQLDWGPNGFLDREPQMIEWIRELGLEGELVQADRSAARRFLLLKGRLVELVGPPKFLLAPLLSVPGRLRLLMEPFIPAKRDDTPESVFDFAARRIGREAAETLVSAMVLGIFGGDAHQLSLAHCFPRMAAMEREHGGLFRAMIANRGGSRSRATGGPTGPGGTLASLRGGIGRLAERAAEVLGEVVQKETPVTGIEKTNEGFLVHCGRAGAQPSPVHCTRVVLAVPAYVAAELTREFAPAASDQLLGLKYASLAVVCVGLKQPKFYPRMKDIGNLRLRKETRGGKLNGFGYLVPPREGMETLGCLWTSSIFPSSAPHGHLLLRTMIGGAMHPEAIELSGPELFNILKHDVLDVIDVRGERDLYEVFRHRRAIPQYGLDHGELLAAADSAEHAHPGLYFTGSAYRGVAMIDCVTDGRRVAERILGSAAR